MLLSALTGPEVAAPAAASAVQVTGLTADSRAVKPGFVFAALRGSKADGTRFIADAVAKGAVAVIAADDAAMTVPDSVAVLRTSEPRRALALMAARFYGTQPRVVVGVTGTNGKTSVAEFTRQIFAACGQAAASLGTIGVVKPDGGVYGSLTTPDPVTLHKTLAELAGEGVTHLSLEASSHGLDQHRLDGVRLTAGAFLNLGTGPSRLSSDGSGLSGGKAAPVLGGAGAGAHGRHQHGQRACAAGDGSGQGTRAEDLDDRRGRQ